MDLQLKNKKVFISGSTKGIGFAAAKIIAREGAEVIINGSSQDSVNDALAKLKKETDNKKISGIPCDFSKTEEINSLIKKLGSVDVLVNNVGIFKNKDFFETTDEDWQNFYNLNVMSAVRLSRALMPKMLENNWGRILFISSESALNIPVEMIHYGMTKTALLSISRGLAELTKSSNVTVNSILPGPTKTEGLVSQIPDDKSFEEFEKEFFKNDRPTSILQRFADPDEVAQLIAYVSSPLSSATNGASLRVEGGVVKHI
jgi:NAD(P)-dependent dehydrogenase (short-subunit alcohol dehydrogenase family)